MNIKERFLRFVFKQFNQSTFMRSILGDTMWQYYQANGIQPDVSYTALVKKYWGWVYACSQISATAFASVPLRLYATTSSGQDKPKTKTVKLSNAKKDWILNRSSACNLKQVKTADDIVEITEHPILDLLDSVTATTNRFELFELSDTFEELTGNAYWWCPKGALGVPDRIIVLRSQWVRIVPSKDNAEYVEKYLYGPDPRTAMSIPAEEVVHFKRPNPMDELFLGFGPVQAGIYATYRQEAMDRSETASLKNGSRPDFALQFKTGKLSELQR